MRFCFSVLMLSLSSPLSAFASTSGDIPVSEIQQTKEFGPQQKQAEEIEPVGQATYEQHCALCHRDGLAGAPRFQKKSDWQARLKKKNIDELLSSALKGVNAMPIKGTCMECSDGDIKEAIEYMLPKS